MKYLNPKTLLGIGLILLGGLMLLEKIGIVTGASSKFGAAVFLLGSFYFFSLYFKAAKQMWWAIIPAMALLGIAGSAMMPDSLDRISGSTFLGALGLAFFIIYFTEHERWWGIIPGGVLITLASVAAFEGTFWAEKGIMFFLGLGLTFLLVAILPTPSGKHTWAYIPALVLMLIGAFLGSQVTEALTGYLLPAILILAGLIVVISFFFKKEG